jgi:hypothetical protein
MWQCSLYKTLRQSWEQAASISGVTKSIAKLPEGYDTLLQDTITTQTQQVIRCIVVLFILILKTKLSRAL